MQFYNKVMQAFWLLFAIAVVIYTTYKGMSEGFESWVSFYFIAVIAFGFWLIRRWMLKRMQKHQEFLNKKAQEEKEK